MYKKDDVVSQLQKVELDILKEFIKVCDELNLNYFLIGGTLIGAIRHKGFIPWDDDIDVCMLRKDYDVFLERGQKLLGKKYFLQTYMTDKEYPNCFAKIRNSETTFLENSVKNRNMNHGIYIDIFPLDNLYKYNKIKSKMIQYTIYNDFYKNNTSAKKRIFALISKMFYGRKNKEELCKMLDCIYTKENNTKTEKVVNYCGAWGVEKESHYFDDYSDYLLVDFEDIKAKVPVGYDRCLRDTYGDYMKLPPKEKRVSHHYSEVIDVNKSYLDYIKKEK